jgi:hypothetical protein
MSKFFCLPNLTTDHVSVSSEPWNEFPVSGETLALPKDEYKKRWFTPDTRHCLFSLCEGQNGAFVVSQGNQCSMIHGFAADFDGVFTPDIIEASKSKAPGRFHPKWWSVSQSGGLHLVWVLDRPIAVAGNAHANELLHVIATKLRVVRWGVGYDPDSEKCTQVMDIGREWHEFDPNGRVPTEEVIAWDAALFESKSKKLVDEVVDVPFDVVSAEIKKREWPHPIPERIDIGTRCVRFWDASADNSSGAQFTKDGIRVYTPHDGGWVSWKRLLGSEFCEQYTAKSMAPFYEDTWYCHTKDEYWRFFRSDTPVHFEKRTEKVLRRDLIAEARLSAKPQKGEEQSELDKALYAITRRNVVDVVAPVIYRPAGKIRVPGIGMVLNTSLLTVVKPAPRVATVSPEELDAVQCPECFKKDPGLCEWDNPFVVRAFPRIHHYLTAMFMRGQGTFDDWAGEGFTLHRPSDGKPHEFMCDRQLVHLVSWLAHFYWNAAKMSDNPPPGTVLILAGPTGVGKSFFATELLGRLMGGWDYADKMYLEGSRFNSETVKKPVHVIDDKLGSKTHRDRLKFTEALKVVSANGRVRCEAKFGSAVEGLPWPGRVVILSNVDSQSLSVLPDLDMSTRDKFTMLRLGGAKYSFGTTEENQKWLAEELPAFARFLLGWKIPAEIRDERFGVKAVQHSDMAQASAENGLTQILVDVLDSCIEETTGAKDDKERGDVQGWIAEGPAVKIYKWIKTVDDSLAREVVDARTLHQNLLTLHKSGGYNIAYDERMHRWSIPYVLRKQK